MRIAAHVVLAVAFAATPLLTIASNAQAADSPASLTIHSDAGEFIGQGKDYSYSRPKDQIWANLGYNQSVVYATVNGLNGDHWTVQLAAPDNQPLQVGTYLDAQGAPFQQAGHPGIEVDQGFTCQTITGQFDVLGIQYTNRTLTYLDATFEEHCNGAAAALTGEIIYTPPPPLPPLSLTVDTDNIGTVNNTPNNSWVTASGTVTCNQYVWTTVSVELNQVADNSNPAFGNVSVSCSPGTRAHWTIYAYPYTPFRPGRATASAYASGEDGYTSYIVTSQTATSAVELIPQSS